MNLKISNQNKDFSGFTLIEMMITLLILGIIASTALPMFINYFNRSKTAEAPRAVSLIAEGEVAYYHRNNAFISAGPTGLPPAAGVKVQLDFGTDTAWQYLAFSMADPTYFGFEADATATNSVDCMAQADLNSNGVTSLFRRTVTAVSPTSITMSPLYIFDEIE